MKKTILDNALFYRVLDSLGEEKEKNMINSMIAKAFDEVLATTEELELISNEILYILSNDEYLYSNNPLFELLTEYVLSLSVLIDNNRELEIFYIRERYLNGLISEEEKNNRIRKLLEDFLFRVLENEYKCLLYELMQIEDVYSEEYKKTCELMLYYKKKAQESLESPHVNYPTIENSKVKRKLEFLNKQ